MAYEHIELTVRSDFTVWNLDAKPPVKLAEFVRGDFITDPKWIERILDSEDHDHVVKVPRGTHFRPTDEDLAEAERAEIAAREAVAQKAASDAETAAREAAEAANRGPLKPSSKSVRGPVEG